jgi:HK97 family phage prohead protease
MEMQTRSATFQPASYNAERGTVEAIISAGADVVRRDHQGEYKERLNMNPSAWTAARKTVPVLKDHQRTVDSVIGRAENVRIESGRALATIRLSDRTDLAGIRRDIETGILDALSFGFTVPKWREFSESGARVREAEQVVVHEVSFVPIGADPQAKTRGEVNMEQQQQEQIRSIATAVGVVAPFADDLIQRGVSVDDARTAIIQEAARNVPRIDNRAPAVVTRDAGDGLITRLADGLLSRMNPLHKPEAGRAYAYHRIADIAREVLQVRGLSTLGSGAELITRAMHSTADFSNVLGEVFNKSLLSLRTSPTALQQVFKRATVADFRARHILEISDGPALLKMREDAQLTYGSITDAELASYSIDSYARGFTVSFPVLVNDNIGALADLSAKMNRGARGWFAGFLANTIIANPVLTDTKAVFHADHANLAAAGAAPSDTTLGTAKLAMRLQTDLGGNPIEATPKFLVIRATIEEAVNKLLATLYPTSSTAAETAARGLIPIVVPHFDKAAHAAWYLFASPDEAPVFEYAELSGYEGPQVETRQGFDTLGTEIRVVWHVGAGAIDSRGAYKNPGV